MLIEIKKELLDEKTKSEILSKQYHATAHSSLVEHCLNNSPTFRFGFNGKQPEFIYKLYIDGEFKGYGIFIEAIRNTFNCFIVPEFRGLKLSREIMKHAFSGIEIDSRIIMSGVFRKNVNYLNIPENDILFAG